MSYCRWSTNDFNCDLYCYFDNGEQVYVTAVARYNNNKKIGLSYDGEIFHDTTKEEFKKTLLILEKEGYNAPFNDIRKRLAKE